MYSDRHAHLDFLNQAAAIVGKTLAEWFKHPKVRERFGISHLVVSAAPHLLMVTVGILTLAGTPHVQAQFDGVFLDDFQVVPNRVVLSEPIVGATVRAYRLSDLNTPIAGPDETKPGRRHRAGAFELALPGVADDEWVLLVAAGGAEMSPSDRPHQGLLRALARASDWRAEFQDMHHSESTFEDMHHS